MNMRKSLSTVLALTAALALGAPAALHADDVIKDHGKVTYSQVTNPDTGLPIYTFRLNGKATSYELKSTQVSCVQDGYDGDLALMVDQHHGKLTWTVNPSQCWSPSGKLVTYFCFVASPNDYACAPLEVES